MAPCERLFEIGARGPIVEQRLLILAVSLGQRSPGLKQILEQRYILLYRLFMTRSFFALGLLASC